MIGIFFFSLWQHSLPQFSAPCLFQAWLRFIVDDLRLLDVVTVSGRHSDSHCKHMCSGSEQIV